MAEDYEFTEELNEQLLSLHKENVRKWRETMADAIRSHPSTFKIMDFGSQDDDVNLQLSKQEFMSHFKGTYNEKLIELLWNELDKTDDGEVKFMEVHRFVQKIKKPSKTPRRTSIHDANWLFETLKKTTFVALDTDEGGTITRDEFYERFDGKEVDTSILDIVFDDIDANGDGDITVMEYIKWQHNFTKKKMKKWKQIPLVAKVDETKEVEKTEFNYTTDDNDANTDNKDDQNEAPPEDKSTPPYTEPPKEATPPPVVDDTPDPVPEPEPEPEPEPKKPDPVIVADPVPEPEPEKPEPIPDPVPVAVPVADPVPEAETPPLRDAIQVDPNSDGRIWVRSDKTGKWRECTIAGENDNDLQIHYISYHPKYDEWISRRSSRLELDRPISTLEESDNLSVWSHDLKAWVEAEVIDVDNDGNDTTNGRKPRVKISYVGVPREEWLNMDDERLSIKHKEADDAYDGPVPEPETNTNNNKASSTEGTATDSNNSAQDANNNNNNNGKSGDTDNDGDQTEEDIRNAQNNGGGCCCTVM